MEFANLINEKILESFFWVMTGFLFINVMQRKHHDYSVRKRYATLYLACMTFFLYAIAALIAQYKISTIFILPAIVIALFLCIALRKYLFPFSLRCVQCKQWLPFIRIICHDSNLCLTDEQAEKQTENS